MTGWPVLCAVPLALWLASCGSPNPPRGVEPIRGFDVARYLGTWYEVARLENRFERGLVQVSAHYALRGDGGISVLNRGYDVQRRRWRQSQGKAYFIASPAMAALKVSFFGPFYGGYHVIALDDDYRYALVCGSNRRYLWILSRTPALPPAVRQAYIRRAGALGFAVEQLRWVDGETKKSARPGACG